MKNLQPMDHHRRWKKGKPALRALLRLSFSLMFLSLLIAACQSPFLPIPNSGSRTIRVVMDNNYPPFAFLDASGNMQGILVDEWQLWSEKTGIGVEITGMDWSKALQAMEAGEFDVIDTIFYNESRARIYDFTKPYATLDVPIYFSNEISGITDAKSLKGFPVAVKSGDAVIPILQGQGVENFKEYTSYEDIIKAAAVHDIIVFVIDKPPAEYFLNKYGLQNKFNSTKPLYSGQFHRAVLKGNSELLSLIEDGFAHISKAEHAAINNKWYGSPAFDNKYLTYAEIALAVGILMILTIALWNRLLQSRVKEKTRALSESEQRFRRIFETSRIGISIADEKGGFLSGNPAMLQILGYTEDEYKHLSIETISHPDDLNQNYVLFKDLWSGKRDSFTFEKRNRHKDGHYVWGQVTSSMVRDKKGLPLFSIGMFEDITDRKRSEKLRDSIYKISQVTITSATLDDLYISIYSILCELIPVENFYIALHDKEDGLIHFPFFKDQYEQTADPLKPGHGLTDYLLRKGKPLLITEAEFDRLIEKKEIELIGKKPIEWLGVPLIINGQIIGVMVAQSYSKETHYRLDDVELLSFVSTQIAQSIDHHKTEEAKHLNEARYRNLFENSPVSLWEEDFSGVKKYLDECKQKGITDFTSYFEDHLEAVSECITRIKILDVNKAALRVVHARTKEDVYGNIERILNCNNQKDYIQEFVSIAAGLLEFEWEGFNSTIDGDFVNVNMHWAVALGYEDSLSKVIVSIVDITDRKISEAKLRYRSGFEELLKNISTRFINLPGDEVDNEINSAVELMGRFENVDRIYLYQIDESNKFALKTHSWTKDGLGAKLDRNKKISLSSLPWFFKELNERPLLIHAIEDLPNVAKNTKNLLQSQDVQSAAIFPLRVNQKLIGYLGLDTTLSTHDWNQENIGMLQQFAIILSNTIERMRLISELQDRAIRDSLTGVFNRRGFSEVATSEMNRAYRFDRPVGLILFDMDRLKTINDTLGHAAGDQIIQEIAQCCLQNIREIDSLGRWGGDEFVVLLPETDLASTMLVAERLRKNLEEHSFSFEGHPLHLTISLGLAASKNFKLTFDELFRNADSALYSAKQAGRNCFKCFAAEEEKN